MPIQGLCHTHALKEAEEASASLRVDLVLESVRGFRKACRKKKGVQKKEKETRKKRDQNTAFEVSAKPAGRGEKKRD